MPIKASGSNLHKGHRQRMREKLIDHGEDVFYTHELLEMLFYHILPQQNTNPIARSLVESFGSLDNILSKSREELMTIDGIGERLADVIKAASLFDLRLLDKGLANPIFELCDYQAAGNYFVEMFSHYDKHVTAAAFLNSKMQLISLEVLYELDACSAGVRADKFLLAATRSNASIAMIIHTHPHGPLFPTEGDRATTAMLQSELSNMGVTLAEHYVITGKRFMGTIKHSPYTFSQNSAIWRFIKSKEEYDEKAT